MHQRKNIFRKLDEIIMLFKNALEQPTTDSHLGIYRVFW